jgi:uncharacterized repeat protein (TIGR03803 family)
VKTIKSYRLWIQTLLVLLALPVAMPAKAQIYSVLYNFGNRSGDGSDPIGNLAQGRDGNLYGTTYSGGINGAGTLFRLTPAGRVRVLYSFCAQMNCIDGRDPVGLTILPDGNFIGAAQGGGSLGFGTIYEITPTGILTVLYNFTGGNDGAYPPAPPIQGPEGNFYGTTWEGGRSSGCGTLYRIHPGRFTLLREFDRIHGCEPVASLLLGIDGNLYGSTVSGGSSGYGVVFKSTPAGKITVLHNFEGVGDGFDPVGALVQDGDGNFYGTTRGVGSPYGGGVFKITPTGTLTVLHSLNGTTDGAYVIAGLVPATDGNFYGVAEQGGNSFNCSSGCGTLFQVTPDGSYSVLYNFGLTDGYFADNTPFQSTNGVLYGDTEFGGIVGGSCGPFGCGVFYSFDAGLPAFVALVPYSGKVGRVVGILGQGFTLASTVSFNGKLAAATLVSGTYLKASVPSGATTGFVTVTTSSGTLTSNKRFLVMP